MHGSKWTIHSARIVQLQGQWHWAGAELVAIAPAMKVSGHTRYDPRLPGWSGSGHPVDESTGARGAQSL